MKRSSTLRGRTRATLAVAIAVLVLGLGTSSSAWASRATGAHRVAPAAQTLHGSFAFYSGGDVNIQDLWTQILIPSFERKYPKVHIDYVFSSHGDDDLTTLDRVAEAEKQHTTSGYALLESATNAVELAARQKLFIPVSTKAIPNAANVPSSSMQVVDDDAIPYRGSKVVLAYNSAVVKDPPTTLAQLEAWIVAHPGEFAYCNPADGGSGSYFVEAVLNSYLTPKQITTLAFTDDTALESNWSQGMAELHSLNSDVYGSGTYPTGNTQVLALLDSGAVDMATVWSDQSLAALEDGGLPKSVKVTSITPAFAGSPVYLGVPKYTPPAQVHLVDAFLNFVLSVPQQAKIVKSVSGFPSINLDLMTTSVKGDFTAVGTTMPVPPYDANISSDMNRVWQQDVP